MAPATPLPTHSHPRRGDALRGRDLSAGRAGRARGRVVGEPFASLRRDAGAGRRGNGVDSDDYALVCCRNWNLFLWIDSNDILVYYFIILIPSSIKSAINKTKVIE